jgi:sRNA-binding regulator protein Hfq
LCLLPREIVCQGRKAFYSNFNVGLVARGQGMTIYKQAVEKIGAAASTVVGVLTPGSTW